MGSRARLALWGAIALLAACGDPATVPHGAVPDGAAPAPGADPRPVLTYFTMQG